MSRAGGGRPTVTRSLTLDLKELMRIGACAPSRSGRGSLTFSFSGHPSGHVDYQSALAEDRGFIRVRYTSTLWNGEHHDSAYRIELETRPQPFGGKRWWFICPKSGALVWKLHLPPGALTFASRQHHRLGYQSQRQGRHDREITRAYKLRWRLGKNEGLNVPLTPYDKPKGMHWKTFERERGKVLAAEAATLPGMLALLAKFQGSRT